ncbi:MAG TPA: TetR/AcrR family transcriptional regulator [Ruania sp.]|nr:TetR/AcrR family transcriptional regulator [Ruania sp.]
MQEEELGLRERKKRARRDALVDATHELVRERGLENVTVEDICERVGVSVRTFFNYFDSKVDAVFGVAPTTFDREVAEVYASGGPTGDLAADTRTLVSALLELPVPSRERMGAAIALMKSEPVLFSRHMEIFDAVRQEMQDVIERRLLQERSQAAGRPELIAMTVFHLARWATALWHEAGTKGHPRDYIDAAYRDIYSVLGPQPPPAS